MKKNYYLLALVLTMMFFANVHVSADPVLVQLSIIDPKSDQDEPQRSPIIVPSVEIEDNVLTFITSCDGMELRLVNEENEVEYTTIISGSTLVVPTFLHGDYQLQIISENFIFYGYITL